MKALKAGKKNKYMKEGKASVDGVQRKGSGLEQT